MTRFVAGVPKEVRHGIKWLKNSSGGRCFYCKKGMSNFRYLWVPPYLNVLCGCPEYHFALNMKCTECNEFKEIAIALGTNQYLTSYCPKCLS